MSLGRRIAGYEQGNLIRYGNMACPFTSSGVAALMAFFPFSGWKDSFFGDLHAQNLDGIEFYTQKKVVIERWPKEWSRKF
jgi:malonate-semialdehyde dehydrogenase (acetylating)/methylmalonate-semialdehyde dehydrogenase